MTSRSEAYETRDLVRATFLIGLGFGYELKQHGNSPKGNPMGAWVFKSSAKLRDRVAEFDDNAARVEPQSFHHLTNRVRRELMSFLEV